MSGPKFGHYRHTDLSENLAVEGERGCLPDHRRPRRVVRAEPPDDCPRYWGHPSPRSADPVRLRSVLPLGERDVLI
jgi:hypothetical protein